MTSETSSKRNTQYLSFLCLAYFTQHNAPWVHPGHSSYQNSIPFYGWIILLRVVLHLFIHSWVDGHRAASSFRQLWLMLLWIRACKLQTLLFPILGIIPGYQWGEESHKGFSPNLSLPMRALPPAWAAMVRANQDMMANMSTTSSGYRAEESEFTAGGWIVVTKFKPIQQDGFGSTLGRTKAAKVVLFWRVWKNHWSGNPDVYAISPLLV